MEQESTSEIEGFKQSVIAAVDARQKDLFKLSLDLILLTTGTTEGILKA